MQKKNLETVQKETSVSTSETQPESGESISDVQSSAQTGEKISCDADSNDEFEKLIKGQYKEAFDKRVQSIINKRFKEIKKAESANTQKVNTVTLESEKDADQSQILPNPKKEAEYSLRASEIVAMGYKDFELSKEISNPIFKALLDGGVDMLTAYQALHIDEIMDRSIRFGAEKAAKQMADSIRFKVGRPSENGLFDVSGFGTRKGVSGLSPKQRKELARKALMGEDVSF